MSEGEGKVTEKLRMIDEFHGGDTKEYAKTGETGNATIPREVMIELRLESIAAASHMANRAYCIGIGDLSQASWEDAPDWQKASALNGVRAKLLDPTVTPEQSHIGWLAEKEAAGWKYGPVKDPEKKEHPCFKPYAELDAAAKAKDDIFLATVISMGKTMGLL